jgi:hypothetical protein
MHTVRYTRRIYELDEYARQKVGSNASFLSLTVFNSTIILFSSDLLNSIADLKYIEHDSLYVVFVCRLKLKLLAKNKKFTTFFGKKLGLETKYEQIPFSCVCRQVFESRSTIHIEKKKL